MNSRRNTAATLMSIVAVLSIGSPLMAQKIDWDQPGSTQCDPANTSDGGLGGCMPRHWVDAVKTIPQTPTPATNTTCDPSNTSDGGLGGCMPTHWPKSVHVVTPPPAPRASAKDGNGKIWAEGAAQFIPDAVVNLILNDDRNQVGAVYTCDESNRSQDAGNCYSARVIFPQLTVEGNSIKLGDRVIAKVSQHRGFPIPLKYDSIKLEKGVKLHTERTTSSETTYDGFDHKRSESTLVAVYLSL